MEVQDAGNKANYKLTSTVMLSIETETDQSGRINLGGSLTRQVIKEDFWPVIQNNGENIYFIFFSGRNM